MVSLRVLTAAADTLVIFGISGDLARKMTFQALYNLEVRGDLDCRVVGVALDEWDDEELRKRAAAAIAETVSDVDESVLSALQQRLSYVSGNYAEDDTYVRLGAALESSTNVAFYLEIPPSLFAEVVRRLGAAGLTENARVVIEKPFGHDLESARALNEELHQILDEAQIMRIDHYLGKEPVMDILYLRFANSIFEPIWNSNYVDSVQITMSEDFGVEDRGSFYDPVGTLRDVVQNHLLQVLALIAMEPPSGSPSDRTPVQDRKSDLFKSMPEADPSHYIRGQYEGYRDVEGVAPDSTTETFVALRLEVDSWRWSGVPFFLRAGKSLPVKTTEVRVIFKRPPRLGIGGRHLADPGEFVLRIKPTPGAELRLQAKKPGADALEAVHLDLLFEEQEGKEPEPYERLLRDALIGNAELFPDENAIEETWRIVQPLLDEAPEVQPYAEGTWGPEAAAHLLHGHGGWRKPWLPE